MAGDAGLIAVELPSGRTLEVATAGDEGAPAFVFLHGTPASALPVPVLVDAALARGWRYLSPSRAGYGGSSRDEGRAVAAAAHDVAAMLDALGHREFVVVGWSGGGPHAIACAAALPARCRAAVSLSGVAPYLPGEFDWMAGMGEENVEEFVRATEDDGRLGEFLTAARDMILGVDPASVTSVRDVFGELICDADAAAATPAYATDILKITQHGIQPGIGGWLDDDRSFVRPWGVELGDVEVPVAIWYGTADLMVPPSHGDWLARNVHGARAHRLEGDGHFSYVLREPDAVFDELAEMAGAPW